MLPKANLIFRPVFFPKFPFPKQKRKTLALRDRFNFEIIEICFSKLEGCFENNSDQFHKARGNIFTIKLHLLMKAFKTYSFRIMGQFQNQKDQSFIQPAYTSQLLYSREIWGHEAVFARSTSRSRSRSDTNILCFPTLPQVFVCKPLIHMFISQAESGSGLINPAQHNPPDSHEHPTEVKCICHPGPASYYVPVLCSLNIFCVFVFGTAVSVLLRLQNFWAPMILVSQS